MIWNTGSCHGTESSPTDELYCLIMCQPTKSHSKWSRYSLWWWAKTMALSCGLLKMCNNKHLFCLSFFISLCLPQKEDNFSEEWKVANKNKKIFSQGRIFCYITHQKDYCVLEGKNTLEEQDENKTLKKWVLNVSLMQTEKTEARECRRHSSHGTLLAVLNVMCCRNFFAPPVHMRN